MKSKFTILDPTGGITVSGDGYVVTCSQGGHHFALLTPEIALNSASSYVKLRVKKQSVVGCFFYLGVIGTSSPGPASHIDKASYGWGGQSTSRVFIAGKELNGHDGFTSFQLGDVAVLKLDTSSHTLKMHNSRLGRVFTISGLTESPYWFHVNLYYAGDQVEVLDMTPSDMKLF